MPTRRQTSSKIQHGLISPPQSPSDKPGLQTNEWPHLLKQPIASSASRDEQHHTALTLHRPLTSTRFSSLGSRHERNPSKTGSCRGRTPHKSENAPPRKHVGFIGIQNACSSTRHRASERYASSRSDNDRVLCSKRRTSTRSTGFSHLDTIVGNEESFLADLQSFDGQSPNDAAELELANTEDEESITAEAITSPKSSCFLADCTLNRRLRPSQRIQTWQTPSCQSPDRFIASRRSNNNTKDILVFGKATTTLTNRERLRRQRSESDDPLGTTRYPSRILTGAQVAQTQQILRAGRLPSANVLSNRRDMLSNSNHRMSIGNLWNGPITPSSPAIPSAFGLVTPTYSSGFLQQTLPHPDPGIYENRLALALDVDRTNRVLKTQNVAAATQISTAGDNTRNVVHFSRRRVWKDNEWQKQGISTRQTRFMPLKQTVPMVAFRYVKSCGCISSLTLYTVLEAPELRDDFYCSVLAYSPTIRRLAVALGSRVFLWSEETGAIYPPKELDTSPTRSSYITSLAFSSSHAGHAVLAIGRGDGRISMYSPNDKEQRFLRMVTSSAASHISFRPTPIRRQSQRHSAYIAENEVFLVGDETGTISVYFVEWPYDKERFLFDYHGGVVLHAKIAIHTQQICGLSWSPGGDYLATGGNDNICGLIQVSKILNAERKSLPAPVQTRSDENGSVFIDITARQTTDLLFGVTDVRHLWTINAAVKAIAFCPWQRGLLAAGGGSNDRCIHFFHTISGACLARIDCAAQVTSLIWSTSRRQIAATFGFAQPEHPFRIAVYSWPQCQQVVAIPWHDEMRALYAIPYPVSQALGRKGGKGRSLPRPKDGGNCVVVAASDGSIKFHEIWHEDERSIGSAYGTLGGSDILEGLHGLDKDGVDTIR